MDQKRNLVIKIAKKIEADGDWVVGMIGGTRNIIKDDLRLKMLATKLFKTTVDFMQEHFSETELKKIFEKLN